jgi:hypothetical protein
MDNVREHGKGFQLIYRANCKWLWETIRFATKSEAQRVLEIREGQVADPRRPPGSGKRAICVDLAEGLEAEYKAKSQRSSDTLKWRLCSLQRHRSGKSALCITVDDRLGHTAKLLS